MPPRSHILYRVLEVLQGVEKLGGYAGYKKYIESPQGQKPAVTSPVTPDSDWDNCYAYGFIATAFIYTAVTLYADNYTGSGGAWGAGVGVGSLQGNLSHAPWSTLRSEVNGFYVQSAAAGVAIELYIESSYVGQFVGANFGAHLSVGIGGYLGWT